MVIMANKERILTTAEVKRKEIFEEKVRELAKQGYERKDLTVSVVQANVMAIVMMLPAVILFSWIYFMINNQNISLAWDLKTSIISLTLLVVLTVVHEGIHGIVWGIFAEEHFRSIEFGVIWKMLTPYCTYKAELKKKQYVLGAIMPTIIVGIFPGIIAIIFSNSLLFLIALIMIIGGGGDAFIVLKLLLHKENGKDIIYIDHPYECGLVAFEGMT